MYLLGLVDSDNAGQEPIGHGPIKEIMEYVKNNQFQGFCD